MSEISVTSPAYASRGHAGALTSHSLNSPTTLNSMLNNLFSGRGFVAAACSGELSLYVTPDSAAALSLL